MTKQDPYATAEESKAILAKGADFRKQRLLRKDMLTVDQMASSTGLSPDILEQFIQTKRVLGLTGLPDGLRIPVWQAAIELQDRHVIHKLYEALDVEDGWSVLSFLENGCPALDGMPPLMALMTAAFPVERVLEIAACDER